MLGRYDADYVRCDHCGFVQTVDPVWLAEAYDEAVVSTDIGSVFRCDELSKIAKTLLHAFFDPRARCLDYGGGYGLFVRRMRDLGYDFRWYDKYCRNLFAVGFDTDLATGERFELLTAFEVFEHLPDPWTEIRRMAELSDNIFFTTELVPTPDAGDRRLVVLPAGARPAHRVLHAPLARGHRREARRAPLQRRHDASDHQASAIGTALRFPHAQARGADLRLSEAAPKPALPATSRRQKRH